MGHFILAFQILGEIDVLIEISCTVANASSVTHTVGGLISSQEYVALQLCHG